MIQMLPITSVSGICISDALQPLQCTSLGQLSVLLFSACYPYFEKMKGGL
jgi:hypothetical protein